METVKSQYKWLKATQKPLLTSQSRPGQAIELDLAQKRITRFSRQTDPQLYVCKKIFCGTGNRVRNAEREYKILQRLDHRHILAYADFSYNPNHYIASLYTKYCEEGDLGLFLPGKPKAGQFTENYARNVALQISSALMYLHHGVTITVMIDKIESYSDLKLAGLLGACLSEDKSQVFLHRDIKPGNIFIRRLLPNYIEVQLGDFGLAKEFDEEASDTYVGTVDYIAPECRRTAYPRKITPKADVWALGTTLQNLTSHLDISKTALALTINDCCEDDFTHRSSSLHLFASLAFARRKKPLLHAAIHKDWLNGSASVPDYKFIKNLLESGAQVNQTGEYGETALHLISWGGDFDKRSLTDLAKLLKDAGADVNAKDSYGFTPSQWKACSEHGLQKQLQGGFSISLPGSLGFREVDLIFIVNQVPQGYYVLSILLAAASGNEGLLRVMMQSNYQTMKHHIHMLCIVATHYCHTSCLKFLLEHMSYVKLSIGAILSLSLILYKLVPETKWFRIDKEDRNFVRLLLFSAVDSGREAFVKLLLETGQVDVNSTNHLQRTPLCQAAINGNEAIVKLLLETNKVDVNSKDLWNHTPLSLAAVNGHEAVVKLLLQTNQINVNSTNWCGLTPLSLAARYGHQTVVKLLLQTNQVNVDSKISNDSTSLSLAAEYGHEAVVKLLLQTNQVNVDSKNSNGSTPLSLAAENGHIAVVRLLQSYKVEQQDRK